MARLFAGLFFSPAAFSYTKIFSILTKNGKSTADKKVVRGSNVLVLASHASLNSRSKHASLSLTASLAALRAGYIYSGNDSGKAGELSILIWYRADTARYHEHEVQVIKDVKMRNIIQSDFRHIESVKKNTKTRKENGGK